MSQQDHLYEFDLQNSQSLPAEENWDAEVFLNRYFDGKDLLGALLDDDRTQTQETSLSMINPNDMHVNLSQDSEQEEGEEGTDSNSISGIENSGDRGIPDLQNAGEPLMSTIDDVANACDDANVGLPVISGSTSRISNNNVVVVLPSGNTVDFDTVMFPDFEEVVKEDYYGPYNFTVTPTPEEKKVAKRSKSVFDTEAKKLFTEKQAAIPFRIRMDYGKVNDLKDLAVRANLVFLENDLIDQAVLRCGKCQGESIMTVDGVNEFRSPHVLRGPDCGTGMSNIQYYQNHTSRRCYLRFPVKSPESGVGYTTQRLSFHCLNSCFRNHMAAKMGIVFYLFSKKEKAPLGRKMIEVRTCTNPVRDWKNESERRVKKEKTNADNDKVVPPPPPKRQRLADEQRPQSSSSVSCVLDGIREEQEETVSSSQESSYSCTGTDEKLHFKTLVKDIKWILRMKNSECRELRNYSSHVFRALTNVEYLCRTARLYEETNAAGQDQE